MARRACSSRSLRMPSGNANAGGEHIINPRHGQCAAPARAQSAIGGLRARKRKDAIGVPGCAQRIAGVSPPAILSGPGQSGRYSRQFRPCASVVAHDDDTQPVGAALKPFRKRGQFQPTWFASRRVKDFQCGRQYCDHRWTLMLSAANVQCSGEIRDFNIDRDESSS